MIAPTEVRTARTLFARLANAAHEQSAAEVNRLSDEVERLTAEVERLQQELSRAEHNAEMWCHDFHEVAEKLHDLGGTVGITMDGCMVVVPPADASPARL